MSDTKPSVLFLSSHDSIRGQMAAALLRLHAGDRFVVHSAGLSPAPVHSLTKKVLEEVGIDASDLEPMRISRFLARVVVNTAIIVCEDGPGCPRMYPFATRTLHWPFEDPSTRGLPEAERLAAFRDLRTRMDARVRAWLEEETAEAASTVEAGRRTWPALQPGI
jgi:arsenate reductase